MTSLSSLSNEELLARLSNAVFTERAATADVIEHLVELDRRRLPCFPFHATRPAAMPRLRQTGSEFLRLGRTVYLEACGSLTSYCIERLGYSEDSAGMRVRVARLVERCPRALEELRAGAIHLTGLYLLAQYLTHNDYRARKVFGDAYIERKQAEAKRARAAAAEGEVTAKVESALTNMGFKRKEAQTAIERARSDGAEPRLESLLRATLVLLAPT